MTGDDLNGRVISSSHSYLMIASWASTCRVNPSLCNVRMVVTVSCM